MEGLNPKDILFFFFVLCIATEKVIRKKTNNKTYAQSHWGEKGGIIK